MSELLNDSPAAVKVRDRIIAELKSGEEVLYATNADVKDVVWKQQNFGIALVVTTDRLLLAEPKMGGRANFRSAPWSEVENIGRTSDGGVLVKGSHNWSWPVWEINVWEGKSYGSPRDTTRLNLLYLCIDDAWTAIKTANSAAAAAETTSAYEELKKRRGF